ncbi:MAG: sigma-70 family RNA polymerase sigma factor [Cyclobacteriaceae bacterium]|nr:sigma-70 family RNA polymerase sigma factor [Cyclobacteriaceae bacterium]
MSIDLKEFEHLFDQYFESLRRFLYYKTGDIETSEDLIQETFLKVWSQREKVNKTTVKSLLYTIASNLAKNHFKHQNIVFEFASRQQVREKVESPQQLLEASEFEKMLQDALASLSEANRTTFLMNRIDGLTYQEIAERLEISVKAVEKRMSNSIQHLYNSLGYKL